jgi:hypothetical protein
MDFAIKHPDLITKNDVFEWNLRVLVLFILFFTANDKGKEMNVM